MREASERTSRMRKRPSFFQDYENEENNLDKILDEFEQEQIHEARKPRVKREPKTPAAGSASGGRSARKRKAPSPAMFDEDKEVELETSRSGRVRKIRRRKVFAFDDPEDEESNSDDEDRDEYQPDSEPDEEYLDAPQSENEDGEDGGGDDDGYKLPLKKRKSGAAMTKEEIEEAKRAAFAAKPHIVVDSSKLRKKDYRDDID